jgi:hypothetical protein
MPSCEVQVDGELGVLPAKGNLRKLQGGWVGSGELMS